MSVKEDFLAIKKEQENWLAEFLNSPNANQLSSYQKENIEKMLLFLVTVAKTNEAHPSSWTGERVVDLVVNHICQMLPEESAFYDAYPETMTIFFDFLAEKGYMLNGKEIGQSLIAAKKDIFQTEEKRNRLEQAINLIQEGLDAGIDFSNPKEAEKYLEKKAKETKVLNNYFEKKEAGKSITEIMHEMSEEDQDILVKDMYKDISTDNFSMTDAKKGLKILQAEIAKGKSFEEASKSVPEELIPSIINLIRPSIMDSPPSRSSSNRRGNAYTRKKKKINRNALCPCGSGKKYKRCCIRKRL